jgi:predicted GTPase
MNTPARADAGDHAPGPRPRRVIILGAAGRDFHDFNVLFRDDPGSEVVAFTAQQIPNIAGRRYPRALAGSRYPAGIPIHPESDLERLIREHDVDVCVMAYSDIAHADVMHLASRANAAGAEFRLPGARQTMLRSRRPVIAVCATRTGAGKSQTTRALVRLLRERGVRPVVMRHPMPYGDLEQQRVQRFATRADLARHHVTIEEREEYEPHIDGGTTVYAGVDYAAILALAEDESDIILWDGGNNDTSFLHADLYITIADPHRAGDELTYHPGETNVRLADVVIINKVDTADADGVATVERNVRSINTRAPILRCESVILADDPAVLRGKRVLAIEDGPTTTHGGMGYGAATIAASAAGAATLVDPRPFAAGSIRAVFDAYPGLGPVLPAMGYGDAQLRDLEATLAGAADAGVDSVAVGTPIDLASIVAIALPWTRVRYELGPAPQLAALLEPLIREVLEGSGDDAADAPRPTDVERRNERE